MHHEAWVIIQDPLPSGSSSEIVHANPRTRYQFSATAPPKRAQDERTGLTIKRKIKAKSFAPDHKVISYSDAGILIKTRVNRISRSSLKRNPGAEE